MRFCRWAQEEYRTQPTGVFRTSASPWEHLRLETEFIHQGLEISPRIILYPNNKPHIADRERRGLVKERETETVNNTFYTFCIFFMKDQRKLSSDVFEDCVDMCLSG